MSVRISLATDKDCFLHAQIVIIHTSHLNIFQYKLLKILAKNKQGVQKKPWQVAADARTFPFFKCTK